MTVASDWQTATDPASGETYWFNPTTGASTWDPPPSPAEAGVVENTQAGSKQQQLALLLANGEARAAAREKKQVIEKAEREASAIADREAREAKAAMLAGARSEGESVGMWKCAVLLQSPPPPPPRRLGAAVRVMSI